MGRKQLTRQDWHQLLVQHQACHLHLPQLVLLMMVMVKLLQILLPVVLLLHVQVTSCSNT